MLISSDSVPASIAKEIDQTVEWNIAGIVELYIPIFILFFISFFTNTQQHKYVNVIIRKIPVPVCQVSLDLDRFTVVYDEKAPTPSWV